MYCCLFLSITASLAVVALSTIGIFSLLTMMLCLASYIFILLALRRRPEAASIYFVCDHEGIYFPSSQARSVFAKTKNVRWLQVPWHNVSDVRIQLLLDETANTKGVVFSIVASASEEHEFLARHSARVCRGGPKSGFGKQCFVGFSNFFCRHVDVISNIERFHTSTPAARIRQFATILENNLAGKG